MLLATVSADGCLVVLLAFLISFLLLLLVRGFGGIRWSITVRFDELHHFFHGIRCAFDQGLHLPSVIFR